MAGPINSIGAFTFLSLRGQAQKVRQQLEVIARPGVDGVGLFKIGSRGTRFQLASMVDTTTKAAARATYRQYTGLIGADPVDLVWSDLTISVGGEFQVAVLDVQPLEIGALLAATGGLNAPSGAFLRARWDLIGIAT